MKSAPAQRDAATTEAPVGAVARGSAGRRARRRWLALLVLSLVVVGWALAWGAPVALSDLWSADPERREIARTIFLSWRPSRVLAGLLVGANLAAAGTALQSAFRNPLAEPYLLGTSSGGALGAALALWLQLRLDSAPALLGSWGGLGLVSTFAFAGALASSALISLLGRSRLGSQEGWSAGFDRSALLLCGVALSSLLSALMSLVVVLSPSADLAQQITFWLLGGLGSSTWAHVVALSASLAVGGWVLTSAARDMNASLLGDEEAATLGVDTSRLHRRLLLAASVMSATAVATAGLIGFVGLLAPHAMRSVFGVNARSLVPSAALGGGVLLCACDAVARSALAPIEIPVGILTALLGVPLFLWLLRR
jgi:iron complex transport system permease protein